MLLRLLLALFLVLPAGLTAGQHAGCAPVSPGTAHAGTAHDSGVASLQEAPEEHHAGHGADHSVSAESQPATECGGCDLACKVSCAAVALPLSVLPGSTTPGGASVHGDTIAGLLNPHPLPLIRPPAPTPA